MSAQKTPQNIRWAFFGTSSFVTPALDELEKVGLVPALVITAPDRPAGRGMKMTPSPVKQWALERGIDVLTPEKLKGEDFVAELCNTEWDLFVVASYGKILPRAVLDIPKKGSLNIHPSILPKFRGPSPFISAILADERETGVTVMEMGEAMDAGPIVAQARVEIEPEDWPPPSKILSIMLFTEGGRLLGEVVPHWLGGSIQAEVQNESLATYTKKFTDEDARLDLHDDPRQNFLKIRAFDMGPRAYFVTERGKRVIVTDAELKNGELKILRVIPEGKKEMDYATFSRSAKA